MLAGSVDRADGQERFFKPRDKAANDVAEPDTLIDRGIARIAFLVADTHDYAAENRLAQLSERRVLDLRNFMPDKR